MHGSAKPASRFGPVVAKIFEGFSFRRTLDTKTELSGLGCVVTLRWSRLPKSTEMRFEQKFVRGLAFSSACAHLWLTAAAVHIPACCASARVRTAAAAGTVGPWSRASPMSVSVSRTKHDFFLLAVAIGSSSAVSLPLIGIGSTTANYTVQCRDKASAT